MAYLLDTNILSELRKKGQAAASVVTWYQHRILPVTAAVAGRWSSLCVDQPLPVIDGLLAATALHHDLVLVTRNVDDVARTGVRLLNPFS